MKKSKIIIIIVAAIIFLILSVIIVETIGGKKTIINNSNMNKSKFEVKENEVSKITLEEYKDTYFTMKIPKGWKVETIGDYIHYTIKAYNP